MSFPVFIFLPQMAGIENLDDCKQAMALRDLLTVRSGTGRDMARFGLLYLRGGRWEDSQIVPREWVDESTRRQVSFNRPGHFGAGYGYLWWILEPDPGGAGEQQIYAAMGFRGQYIFVVPEHDLVVVVTGGTHSYADEQRPIEFLYSDILPAVRR